MPSFFYLYTFVFLAQKLFFVFKQLFFKKKDDAIEIDLTSTNVGETLSKVFSFTFLISIFNSIWLLYGIFNNYERILLCLILFVDLIGITSLFDKTDPDVDKKYALITLTVKIAVACLLIYKHVLNYQGI